MGNSCCGLSNPLQGEQQNSFPKEKKSFRKMNYYKPSQVTKGVSVKRNPQTGLYEGFPKEWVQNNQIDIGVDISKVVTTSHLSSSIRPQPKLPSNILNRIQRIEDKPPRLQGYQKVPMYIQAGNGSSIASNNSHIGSHKRGY